MPKSIVTLLLLATCIFAQSPRTPDTLRANDTTQIKIISTDQEKAQVAEVTAMITEWQGKDLPIREVINWYTTDNRKEHLYKLKEGLPFESQKDYHWAQSTLGEALKQLPKAIQWPQPTPISIPKTHRKLVIDGILNEKAWTTAQPIGSIFLFYDSVATDKAPTKFYSCWDKSFLYFAFVCTDKDILAPEYSRDGEVFSNDCVEMFIRSDKRLYEYWELIVSPSESIYDGLHTKNENTFGPISHAQENIAGLQTGVQINGTINQSDDTDKSYTVEVAVPMSELPGFSHHGYPSIGDTINFMLIRLDKTNNRNLRCYSFKPLLMWGHNIWNHYPVVLSD